MAISLSEKRDKNQKGRLWVHDTLILVTIIVNYTENSSIVIIDTKQPQ